MRRKVLVLLLLLGASCTSTGGGKAFFGLPPCHPTRLLRIGDRIPDCSFRSFDGSVLKLTSLQRPTVMNFWASWCTDCIQEMPSFEQVFSELGSKVTIVGFNALGISGENERDARSFAKKRGVTYALAFDPTGLLYSHFSLNTAFPATIFVSASGVVQYRQFGALDRQTLTSLIHKYLKV
ncbi:MAG: TlpA family protein disulfide reductase [Actinomycetota bacterium]